MKFWWPFCRRASVSQELAAIQVELEKILATMTDVNSALSAQSTTIQTVVDLLVALKAKVDAGGVASSADLDTIVNSVTTNTGTLAAAVTANTPT